MDEDFQSFFTVVVIHTGIHLHRPYLDLRAQRPVALSCEKLNNT